MSRAVLGSDYLGRLAPSPTGYLQLGHAATFLAAQHRASQAGGQVLLRLDDLDLQRSREHFAQAAREDLQWLGIEWAGEWRQQHRLERYRAAMQDLLTTGLVYACTCTRRDLEQALEAPHEDGDEPMYSGHCRPSLPQRSSDRQLLPGVNYRFRVPEGDEVEFNDSGAGTQRFVAGKDFGDFVVWRKEGLPSYQLATVVDDADMGVTEVVRGRDLLRSTARQLLLQKQFGFPKPAFHHVPLLRDRFGQRLAKRQDALSLRSLRAQGVTPAEIRSRVEASLHHNLL